MPAARSRGTPDRVQQLKAAAPTKEINNIITLNLYYRSANFLLQQAQAYRRSHNEAQLYVMLLRFVSLVVETIPKHRDFLGSERDGAYARLRAQCAPALAELAQLQASLALPDTQALQSAPYLPKQVPGAVQLSSGHVPGLHWDNPAAAAAAADLDLSALERLGAPGWAEAAASTSSPAALPAAPRGPPRPSASAPLPDLTSSLALPAASQATLDKHAILPPPPPGAPPGAHRAGAAAHADAERPLYSDLLAALSLDDGGGAAQPSAPPLLDGPRPPSPYDGAQLQLGPQELAVLGVPPPTAPPPPGETCCVALPPGGGAVVPVASAPADSRIGGGVVEVKRRQQVRNVHISAGLMDEFLRYASPNSRRNVETCGILAGCLSTDDARFNVTTLIVPKQEGSSDMVQALAEEEIFEAQDSRALYPLGWIHTHPSQTCFLSSIDVHTQCGYQTMLDEAIAIVMAPRDARSPVGIFRLTTPGGLSLVQRCEQRGFHPHPPTSTGQPVYELSGHVYLNPRVSFEVVDLR